MNAEVLTAPVRAAMRAPISTFEEHFRHLLLALLASGCAGPFAYTQLPESGHVWLDVEWNNSPQKDCNARSPVGGCAYPAPGACTIYVPKPRSFEDHERLELVGHEVVHCLGARHEWH